VRTTDSVCRMGGDEFMLILEGAGSAHEIERIGQRVLRCLTEGYAIHDRHVHITPSIGAVVHDGHESDTELVQRADAAMYTAKRAGKCRLVLVSAAEEAGDTADAPASSAEPGPLLSLISSPNSNDKEGPAEGKGATGSAGKVESPDHARQTNQPPSHAA
jgi:Diguanylate cyclase, GGDEF domain